MAISARDRAMMKMEKSLASARKRARDLGEKVKKGQPVEIASTVAGGAAGGALDANTPQFLSGLGLDYPSAAVGIVAISYGLFSRRSGQLEKISTCLGTGMLAGVSYDYAKTNAML